MCSTAPMTTSRPMAGPILWVTMSTSDIARSREVYGRALGFRTREEGRIAPEIAEVWEAPALEGAAWALIAPQDAPADAPGALLLVEAPCTPGAASPLASFGWAAAELSVSDADARVDDARAAGFAVLGPVRPLGSNPAIRAGQVAGPSGEALYLTDVRAYEGALDLHRAVHPADRCFIAVLASPDLEADRQWLEAAGIGRRISDREVAVPVLSDTLALAPGRKVRISSLQLAGGCLIEIDAYPEGTPSRESAGGWPCGVAMVTLADDSIVGRKVAAPPYGGRMVRVDRLPGGARIERVATA